MAQLTQFEYVEAVDNYNNETTKFINNEYFKTFIPNKILETIEYLSVFLFASQKIIFKDGKLMKLSLLNIIAWWKFLKLAYKLVNDIAKIWK